MSLIKRMRKQRAVYWKRSDPDEYGRFTFDLPVEIRCRWDDEMMNKRSDKDEVEASNATIYVDREMVVGDRLKKGEMDSETMDDPLLDPKAHEIFRFIINPNFRHTENLYTALI